MIKEYTSRYPGSTLFLSFSGVSWLKLSIGKKGSLRIEGYRGNLDLEIRSLELRVRGPSSTQDTFLWPLLLVSWDLWKEPQTRVQDLGFGGLGQGG